MSERSVSAWLLRGVYTALLYLAIPLVLGRLWRRGRRQPAYRRRIAERFGFLAPAPAAGGPRIWLHAVSVGEFEAARPLIQVLQARYPQLRLLITSTTPTGAARVHQVLGETVEQAYAPYDLPDVVARFLARRRPELLIVMETEWWPNWLRACRRRGVPTLLANGRLSARSAARYARLGPLTRRALADFSALAMQSPADVERVQALGAPAPRCHTLGSLKFDVRLPAQAEAEGLAWRAALGNGRPCWIAASTHPGEEEAVLAAHRALRRAHPTAALVLAPRHPERADEVVTLCTAAGLAVTRRSTLTTPLAAAALAEADVLVVDTLGELAMFFCVADVAFVGGSLVPVGGHNLLEPAAAGVPVLSGPALHNFQDIAEQLTAAGALGVVDDEAALATALGSLLGDAPARGRAGEAGRACVAAGRGATERHLALVARLLGARGRDDQA